MPTSLRYECDPPLVDAEGVDDAAGAGALVRGVLVWGDAGRDGPEPVPWAALWTWALPVAGDGAACAVAPARTPAAVTEPRPMTAVT